MILNLSGGFAGVELNFEIIGGTTRPSKPVENTIWVNTDTEITCWEFSPNRPTGVQGMVWIQIDMTSNIEINALKENCIEMYPTSAYQYINGRWVQKEVQYYQNGKWLDGFIYLYNRGNEYESITGGWYSALWDGGGDGDGSTSYDSSSIDIYCYNNSSNGRQIQGAITHNKINLSNITKIYAIGNMYNCPEEEGYKDSNVVGIAVMDSDEFLWSGEEGTPGYVVTYDCVNELGNFNIVIDVTKLTGSYYIAIYGFANSRHVGGTFSQIYCK